jgi:O-antigen/teichoic acid export membrane protein
MDTIGNNKRIAKNTLLLYFRMIITMIISLFTSRIVLNTLGIIDFGIYNVVGGVVVMFGFLNSAMASSTQRFLTFELGKQNSKRLKEVFSMSVTLHIIISIVIILLSETIGVWFINSKLTIPVERLTAANWVFQFSVLTSVLTILSVPYDAAIISHERMNVFAYISILEVTLKLVVVYLLQLFGYDKLVLYSVLIFLVSLVLRIIYGIYCTRNFKESKYYFYWEKPLFIEMTSFAGWNLFGVFAGIGYGQGVNILLNIFFGPVVNAARGIAFQVMGAVNQLINNFQIAVNPPITKAYAVNDGDTMYKMIFSSSKFSFYLLLLFIFPLFIETKLVLSIWLKNVPDYTISFTRLVLIDLLICSLSGPLQILAQATGKVRNYQLVVSTILLLNLPFSYILLKTGYPPQSTFVASIILSTAALFARLIVLKKLTAFPVGLFFNKVVLTVILVTIFMLPFPLYIEYIIKEEFWQFFLVVITTVIGLIFSIWLVGLSVAERLSLEGYINRFRRKISIKNEDFDY